MLPAGPLAQGFPHLGSIRRSLRTLIPRIRDGRLPAVPGRPWTAWSTVYDMLEPELSVQRLARVIADAYHLKVGTIVVTFDPNLPVPGRVALGASDDFIIELKSNLKLLPRDISAVLGHEVAHIFLHRHGLRRPDTLEDEILTDTAAALYGFGVLALDTYSVSQHTSADGQGVTYTERRLGYLTPVEVGYVLEKGGVAGTPEHLTSHAPMAAFRKGARRHRRDLGAPLADCPWWSRGWYRLWRWITLLSGWTIPLTERRVFGLSRQHVEFRCPICTQRLRLPVGKAVRATCGTCRHTVPCET